MKTITLVQLSVVALALAGCRDDSSGLNREQQNYEVVQEGAASGVTSTITGPGETAVPLTPALTGTNADTTTAFTIPSNLPPSTTAAPGTIAGTLPTEVPPTYGTPSRPVAPRPTPVPQPPSTRPPEPTPPPTETAPQTETVEPTPQPEPPPSDETETPSTETAPPPPPPGYTAR